MLKPFAIFCSVAASVVICATLGCGGGGAPEFAAEDHALNLKTTAMEFVQQANQSPKTAQEAVEPFLEAMEAYESGPVGSYGETYAQLLEAAKAVQSGTDVEAQISKIESLAGQLPGEVVLEVEDLEED